MAPIGNSSHLKVYLQLCSFVLYYKSLYSVVNTIILYLALSGTGP